MPKPPENFKPLLGIEETTIDDKGRVQFPKGKRERLEDEFTLVLGKSGGVVVYPQAVFNALFEEAFSVDTMNPHREAFTRLVLGNAYDDVPFDAQGRIVVPKRLREEARLTGVLLLVGCGDRLEIWDQEEWVKFNFAPEKYNVERRDAIDEAYSQMLFSRQATREATA